MEASIPITDLGTVILFLLAMAVGFYAILALRNVSQAAREISEMVGRHRHDLEALAACVPQVTETTHNAAEISREAKSRIHEAGSALGTITQETADTMLRVNETADQIATYAIVFGEIAKAALGLLTSGKRT